MPNDVKDILADRVRWVFGNVAEQILKIEEQRHGMLVAKEMTPEDKDLLLKDLRELCLKMAGPVLAERLCEEVSAAILIAKPRKK
jgi:hypothetical protein